MARSRPNRCQHALQRPPPNRTVFGRSFQFSFPSTRGRCKSKSIHFSSQYGRCKPESIMDHPSCQSIHEVCVHPTLRHSR